MAIKYAEINGLQYEINEKGERVLVRSTDSSKRAYLRFRNMTSRPVNVWWRDFRGAKHHYVYLDPGAYYDINTYITHPWEFTDAFTNEHYVVNNCPIYKASEDLGGMMTRTNWNITVKVRTLRNTALLALAERLHPPDRAGSLGLPLVLEGELRDLIDTLHEATPLRQRPYIQLQI